MDPIFKNQSAFDNRTRELSYGAILLTCLTLIYQVIVHLSFATQFDAFGGNSGSLVLLTEYTFTNILTDVHVVGIQCGGEGDSLACASCSTNELLAYLKMRSNFAHLF